MESWSSLIMTLTGALSLRPSSDSSVSASRLVGALSACTRSAGVSACPLSAGRFGAPLASTPRSSDSKGTSVTVPLLAVYRVALHRGCAMPAATVAGREPQGRGWMPMVTAEDVRRVALSLPRSYEALVGDRVKF